MRDRFKNAVDKVGGEVTVITKNGKKTGNAVIYPIRNERRSYGDRQNVYEGACEPQRYEMFCDREIMKYARYGDIVIYNGNSYILLWTDEFSCRAGSYIKSCLKKVADEE